MLLQVLSKRRFNKFKVCCEFFNPENRVMLMNSDFLNEWVNSELSASIQVEVDLDWFRGYEGSTHTPENIVQACARNYTQMQVTTRTVNNYTHLTRTPQILHAYYMQFTYIEEHHQFLTSKAIRNCQTCPSTNAQRTCKKAHKLTPANAARQRKKAHDTGRAVTNFSSRRGIVKSSRGTKKSGATAVGCY